MKYFTLFTLIAFIYSVNAIAQTGQLLYITEGLTIKSYDTKFIEFPVGHNIDRISFEAKLCSGKESSQINLTIDGHIHNTISINTSGWRTYTATFNEFSRTLEISTDNIKRCVKIKNVKILPRRHNYHQYSNDYISYGQGNTYYIVQELLLQAEYLSYSINSEDKCKYIDPFILTASKVTSVLQTSAEISNTAKESLVNLVDELNKMSDFITKLMLTPEHREIGQQFDKARTLLGNYLKQ